MQDAPYDAPQPSQPGSVVIAAMMPKTLELAVSETSGTLTYLTTTAQIARYRTMIGPQPWICAVQVVILETDASIAWRRGREYLRKYLSVEQYPKRWSECGFVDADSANGDRKSVV